MKKTMPLRLQRYMNTLPLHVIKMKNHNHNNMFGVDIVYFANLFVNPTHGPQLVKKQLSDLCATGLLEQAKLYIVLSLPPTLTKCMRTSIQTILPVGCTFELHFYNENCHEYPGIQLVYSLACQNSSSNHYILYFHSKSITRFQGKREPLEKKLHETVIARWQEVLHIFQSHPSIDKIGSTASKYGFIWWNYWWARASYLVRVESPLKTSRRHYYEDWLCRVPLDATQYKNKDPHRPEQTFQSGAYNHQVSNCWGLSFPHNPAGRSCNAKDTPQYLFNNPEYI